jgi:hypothetical protein
MATIEYSALVNRIKGRVSHGVLSNWKGMGIIKRHSSGVHQPRTQKQQEIRGMLSDLAGEFYALTSTQKELWDSWVTMIDRPMTALNAYVSHNQRLQKYFPGMAKMTGPPPTPATPEFPMGLAVTALAAADFCVTWTSPNDASLTAIVDYWAMPGLDNTINPRWTFGASAGADALLTVVATAYPTDTRLKFRVRVIDTYSRVSPWSHILTATAL